MTVTPLIISVDPWSLTLISVGVVFSALIILFALYSLSGAIFTGKFKRKPRTPKDSDTAAAIAMALDLYCSDGDEVPVAIAVALSLYLSDSVHDAEPGFITIQPSDSSAWRNKALTYRKSAK